MNYRKKILIVGGTGFIGYHLAKKGIKKGWAVTSASSRKPQKVRYLKKVKYIISDITNKNSLKRIKGNFDYVVNLGGYVNHAQKKKKLIKAITLVVKIWLISSWIKKFLRLFKLEAA